jgi:hypothetical protein
MPSTNIMIPLTKVFRISVLVVVVLAALVTIVGKGGGGGTVTPPATTTSVAIEPATAPAGLPVNFPVQLAAKATLSDGQVTDVTNSATWTSANSNIVEVSATGVVTGKTAGGPVAVTANSGGKDSSPLNIEVKSNLMLTKLEVTPFSTAVLPVGQTRTHTAMATFSDGTTSQTFEVSEEVQWTSENEAVVRFDAPSAALGVAKGNTMIFATEPNSATNSNKLPIYVDIPVQARLEVSPIFKPGKELIKGFNFSAKATMYFGAAEPSDVTEGAEWSSTSPGIVSVSNAAGSKGFVTPMSAGKATISAMVNGLTAEAEYTVDSVVVESLSISVPVIMPVGLDVKTQVFAVLDDSLGTRVDVSEYAVLSVVDPQVATVSNAGVNKGYLTGLKAGETSIRAELPESSLPPVSQAIAFEAVPLGSIAVTDPNPGQALYAGRTSPFTARGTFPGLVGGDNEFDVTRQVTWTSSMESIATISNAIADKGLVSALAAGTTSISAEFEGVSSPGVNRDVSPATLESIAIVPTDSTVPLAAGTLQLTAMGTFSDMQTVDITESVNWIPGPGDVARFDNRRAKGLAIFNQSGSTSVTAAGTGALSGHLGVTQLTVGSANPTAVAISGPNVVEVGKETQLTAAGTFDDMSMADVTLVTKWSADNGNVVIVSGVVRGAAPGMSTITATYGNGLIDTHMITVNPAP